MAVLTGDFISFSFNGHSSSELGIIRTSDGSRFNDNLLPSQQDYTAAVPGGDGTYYWGTNYTQRQINIPIAFDSLNEVQYRNLRKVFGKQEIGKLIFDEAPYKYYMAKVSATPQINSICFEDKLGQRIYKGEGQLSFICYFPYAKSQPLRYIFTQVPIGTKPTENLEQYRYTRGQDTGTDLSDFQELPAPENDDTVRYWKITEGYEKNYEEWFEASGFDLIKPINDSFLKNTGDLDTDLLISFSPLASSDKDIQFSLSNEGRSFFNLTLSKDICNAENSKKIFIISSKTNLLSNNGLPYNSYIKSGDFFKLPADGKEYKMTVNDINKSSLSVQYDYLYF